MDSHQFFCARKSLLMGYWWARTAPWWAIDGPSFFLVVWTTCQNCPKLSKLGWTVGTIRAVTLSQTRGWQTEVLRNDGKECSARTKVRSREGNKSKSNYALGMTGQRSEMEVGDEVWRCWAGDVGFKTQLQLVCCALACWTVVLEFTGESDLGLKVRVRDKTLGRDKVERSWTWEDIQWSRRDTLQS